MARMTLPALLMISVVGACATWPELPPPPKAALDREAPRLLPLDTFADAETEATAASPSAGVEARAADLRSRAAILAAPISEPDDIDAIRARLAPPE